MIVDFNGGTIYFRRDNEKGEYLHTWRSIVAASVKADTPLILRNWRLA